MDYHDYSAKDVSSKRPHPDSTFKEYQYIIYYKILTTVQYFIRKEASFSMNSLACNGM